MPKYNLSMTCLIANAYCLYRNQGETAQAAIHRARVLQRQVDNGHVSYQAVRIHIGQCYAAMYK